MNKAGMLKHAWLKHRERVRQMRAEVDHDSPPLQVSNVMQPHQLKVDADLFVRLCNANTDLLMNMNRLARTQGVIDSFPKPILFINPLHKRRTINKRLKELEKINALYGRRILAQKAELDTFPKRKRIMSQRVKVVVKPPPFQAPMHILSKYDQEVIKLPKECVLQQRLLRPRIYLDLFIKDLRSLGRLVFELYTEASPQVVLEFMRACKATKIENFRVLRIFPSLWLEAELLADEGTLTCKPHEYDMRALDHDCGAGVLAYSTKYLKGFDNGIINFSLSFKPLRVLQGRRVAFGRLVNGIKILDCMQDYGTKNGKLRRAIIVTGCGIHN